MQKRGVYPKIVQERLGRATISMTLDIYSYIAPGLKEAAAAGFNKLVLPRIENEPVKMIISELLAKRSYMYQVKVLRNVF
jgi:hypothetical protein